MTNQELVIKAIKSKKHYRDKLELSPSTRFGLEIEMDHLSNRKRKKLQDLYNGKHGCNIDEDTSLKNTGIELSTRIMDNKKENWEELYRLSILLKKYHPEFEYSSFQVNLDCHMDYNEIYNFLQFYAYYEDIITRISKGTDMVLRYSSEKYAIPILRKLKSLIKYAHDEIDIVESFINNKSYGLSLKESNDRTNIKSNIDIIEFRSPNGTINPILWQNYIMLFQSMINFFEQGDWYGHTFDLDNITRDEYNINKAIEFANIIYTSEEEKLLFLKQYIGNRKIESLLLTKKRSS